MFEYKNVLIRDLSQKETPDPKIEAELNRLGREGWELVYFSSNGWAASCVFKRRK